MKRILANNRLMTAAAVTFALAGLCVSMTARDFSWFGRSGSLITLCGVIVLTRPTIVGRDVIEHVIMAETGKSQLDPAHYEEIGEAVPDWVREDQQSRRAIGVFGPLLTLVGTLVWGFGDLLNHVIC